MTHTVEKHVPIPENRPGKKLRYPYDIEIGDSFELHPDDPDYVANRMNYTMRRRGDSRRYTQRGRRVWRVEDDAADRRTLSVRNRHTNKRKAKKYRTLAVGEHVDYESALPEHTKHSQIRRYAYVSGKEFRVTRLTPNRGIRVLRVS